MRLLLIGLVVAAAIACGSESGGPGPRPQPTPVVPPAPEPPPPPPPSTPPAGFRLIGLAERITDSIGEEERRYAVAVPRDGVMLIYLEWSDDSGAVTLLLEVNDQQVDWTCAPTSPWPVEGHAAARAGEYVRVVVRSGPGCWDYGVAPRSTSQVDFALTAVMP